MAQNPNPSLLEFSQIIKRCFNAADDNLRVEANIVANIAAAQEVIISHIDDSIRIGDGVDLILVTAAGEMNVLATAQPGVDVGDVTINNATGASAVNIQDGGNSITVDGIVAATQSGIWNITNVTGTVSLPTGAATSANQTNKAQFTHITDGTDDVLVTAAGELNVLSTAQPGIDIGDVTINNAAGASAVNIQDGGNSITIDGSLTNISGTISLPTGASTSANQTNKTQFTHITDGTDDVLVTGAGELNVLATAQPGVDIGDVTINNTAGAGAVNIQDGGNSITIDGSLTNITGTISLPTGASTSANQTSELTLIGAVTEAAPASDTASSGLNGRLQRIAQNITTLDSDFNTKTGATTETAPATDTALSGLNGRLQRIAQNVTTYNSDFDTRIGALTETAPATDTASSGLNGRLQRVAQNITTYNTDFDSRIGAITETAPASDTASSGLNGRLQRVAQNITTYNTDFDSRIGAITETAPATDTASSGLNGRLQRIAQRLTSLIAIAATETTLAKLTQTQGSTTSGQSGPLIQGAVTTSAPAYTTAQTSPISLTLNGGTRVDVNEINGSLIATGNGVTGTGSQRVTIASDTTPVQIQGNVASAATDSGNPIKTGAIVSTTVSAFTSGQRADSQADKTGSTYVNNEGRNATYGTSATFTAVASATDVFTLTGSATKTIKLRKVTVSGTNTGNTNALVLLVKRSTANSAGTSTTPAINPNDSTNAAATAVARAYTANPTLGTLVANHTMRLAFFPQLASSNVATSFDFNLFSASTQPIYLRGTSEVVSVNLNAVALGGTTVVNISMEWTEE